MHNDKPFTIHVPHLCPVKTLKECLNQTYALEKAKIAYFQTTNADWLTDYKLQTG